MFLRWLFTTFPREMLQGWALLRPDLVLWLALAALLTVATLSIPPPSEATPSILPFLIGMTSGLLTTMLPAVLFTAQIEGRQLTWGPVLQLLARRAGLMILCSMIAYLIASGAAAAMLIASGFALGESSALIPVSTVASVVILVSLLVRFSFLPFLVILFDREKIPAALWRWPANSVSDLDRDMAKVGFMQHRWVEVVAGLFWPLTASARLTEGNRWRLVFYTLLGLILPEAAAKLPSPLLLPALVVTLVTLTTVQGVFFLHFRRRCDETGVEFPTLPLESAPLV